MKLIKFIHTYDYDEKFKEIEYFSLKDLISFSYDSGQCIWKFEFPNKTLKGHAQIDVRDFELFLTSNSMLLMTFEDCPLDDDDASHLREVKKANQE